MSNFSFLRTKRARSLFVVAATSAVTAAHAAGATIDTTAATDAITAAGVAIATVGAAFLAMTYGAKVFRWIKGAV